MITLLDSTRNSVGAMGPTNRKIDDNPVKSEDVGSKWRSAKADPGEFSLP